jgi:hypothetical protein
MPTKLDLAFLQRQTITRSWWTPVASLLAAGLATTLVACGGGGGGSSAGLGTGGTGSFAVGTISGFGSIIVNGVRYDDSSASIVDDDDSSSSLSALSIGQVVEIRGSVNSDGVTGTASSIAYYSALKGPVTAVNVGAGTVTVFGQVVNVTPTTLFVLISTIIFAIQQVFTPIDIMTEGGPQNGTTNLFYMVYQYAFRTFNVGFGAAGTVVIFAFLLAVTLLKMRVLDRHVHYQQ